MPITCDECGRDIGNSPSVYCGRCDCEFIEERERIADRNSDLLEENEALHIRIEELEKELELCKK